MIASVILWTNGMVTVFDERGQQVPEYAGRFEEVWQRIYAEAPAAQWQIAHYRQDGWVSESFRLGWPGPRLIRGWRAVRTRRLDIVPLSGVEMGGNRSLPGQGARGDNKAPVRVPTKWKGFVRKGHTMATDRMALVDVLRKGEDPWPTISA
jgi:hypothetical protein